MKYLLILPFFAALWAACAPAPPPPPPPAGKLPMGMTSVLEQTMPVDRKVQIGTLENGLRYYIRPNDKPENRLELRLVVRVGSVLEEEDQQGLAYFIEHLAFQGTAHFSAQELVDYLKSTGMAFGPEVNAYSGFDQTVYELQVPTDSTEVLETAFRLLADWAHQIDLTGEAIDRQRKLGSEGGTGEVLPVLLRGSRYAERLPGGRQAGLDTFRHQTLQDFYRTWYRPDLMAVVAVGDSEPQWVVEQIRKYFDSIPKAARPVALPRFSVPDHEETRCVITGDPEATDASISVYRKRAVRDQQTVGAYRQHLGERLYLRMLNRRLNELTARPNPPFLAGGAGQTLLVRATEMQILACRVAEDGVQRGLEGLLTEARRVYLHGFTASELEREKKEMMSFIEQVYRERDKTESRSFAEEYSRNFLNDEPIPGIEYEYGLHQTFVPEITVAEVDEFATAWNRPGNRVIAVSLPEREGVAWPAEEELQGIVARVETQALAPYQDDLQATGLMAAVPEPGRIVGERLFPEVGVTEWTLANGARVVLKPTAFKDDQILFSASSPGGHSLVPDSAYVAALTADAVVREGGVGNFDKVALDKMLAGRVAQVTPWIDDLQEGLRGEAAAGDAETLFQLIHLYMTAPRRDSTAFVAYQAWLRGMIGNRSRSPEAAFMDTVQVTLVQHHFRARPWSPALVEEMDLDTSLRVYRDRFGDAGDFTFFFVGDFSLDELRPLVQRYLGSLPSAGRQETWRNVGIEPPRGVVEKYVYRDLGEESLSRLVFTGRFVWNYENFFLIDALGHLLRIKLREALGENHGGAGGVGVSATHYPEEEYRISVHFSGDPEQVEEFTGAIFAQIDSLVRFGPDSAYVQLVQQLQRRQRQVDLEENGFWCETLETCYYHGLAPRQVLDYEGLIDRLDRETVRQAAEQYFRKQNYVRVVLLPERYRSESPPAKTTR